MSFNYRPYVLTKNIEFIEDANNMYRYLIRVPFSRSPQNRALVILKNPSIATGKCSDYTINKICEYCYKNGFDEIIVTNLFAYRSQKSSVMVNEALNNNEDIVGPDNDNYIKAAVSEVNKIIVAWGEHPSNYKKQYIERIKKVMKILKGNDLFYVGKLSKKDGYPLHAQVWSYNMPLIKIENE